MTGREVRCDLFFWHEPDAPCPSRWWIVQNIVNFESRRIFVGQLIELFLEENILVVNVSINETQPGGILGVLKGSADDLQHGCDTGASGDHANFTWECWRIVELTLWTFNANVVANLEERNIAGDVALLVRLGAIRNRTMEDLKKKATLIRRSKWPRSSSLLVGV
jgi:hypothetical protein